MDGSGIGDIGVALYPPVVFPNTILAIVNTEDPDWSGCVAACEFFGFSLDAAAFSAGALTVVNTMIPAARNMSGLIFSFDVVC